MTRIIPNKLSEIW